MTINDKKNFFRGLSNNFIFYAIKILILFLLLNSTFVLAADEIPEELKELGYSKKTLIDHYQKGELEYFTFSDWTDSASEDVITFVLENGIIKEWFMSQRNTIDGLPSNQGEAL